MEDAYEQLRAAARRKRDVAIAEVRKVYRRELEAIQRIKDSLYEEDHGNRKKPGPKPRVGGPRTRTAPELVKEYMPRDRQFTIAEIREKLLEVEPTRRFYRASLRTTFANLKREGAIRRVKRISKGQVLWECVATAPTVTPLAAMLLPEAVEVILGECGPLRPVEIVLALQERGYRREANPKILANSLQSTLRRCAGRFTLGDDGRWQLSREGVIAGAKVRTD
jgi:hypothetical protein